MADIIDDPASQSMNVDIESTEMDRQAIFRRDMAARIRARANALSVNQSALADASDIKRSTMTHYWKGDRPYPLESLALMATRLSTTVNWLLTGLSASDAGEDAVVIEEIDLSYGLGGTYSDGPIEVQRLQFPRDWIASITNSPAADLTFARGRGDSMQPTLQDGDIVLIDRSLRTVREQDAIWAMTIGDIAMIKRLRVRGERVLILSDSDRVSDDEAHVEEINIVGRVIFIGRKL